MLRALATLSLLSGALALPANTSSETPQYDFVIVGGGTAGLVVANRLSEDAGVTVAVIEAGGSVFDNPNVTDINGYSRAFGTDIDWAYESTNQTHAEGKSQTMRAGKALGGTSTINGMNYLRAEVAQIDAWEKLGNTGWNWDSLLPYYIKSEGLQSPTAAQIAAGAGFDPDYHGPDGPLLVGWPTSMMTGNIVDDVNSTYQSLGLPWNADPNNGSMRGFAVSPKTIDITLNVRADAARAYYYPFENRTNLHVYLNSFAARLVWDEEKNSSKPFANGVEYTTASGETKTITANKEVILSAGSLRSPLLLEHSGIGNPTILNKFNISVKVDNPYVGENLQDQTTGSASFAANFPSVNLTGSGSFVGYFSASEIFGSNSTFSATVRDNLTSYAETVVNATGGVLDVDVTKKLFEIHHDLIFKDNLPISEILVIPVEGSVIVSYWGLLPFSRGNIHISSADASASANIDPQYYLLDYDVQQQIGTAKISRAISSAEGLGPFISQETQPGLDVVPANATEEEWTAWVKSSYRSNFHYLSTAAMMSEELGGVVDPNLLVYGTENVRVIDASVLPMQVCGHLTATLYAVAEKAADAIKAKYA